MIKQVIRLFLGFQYGLRRDTIIKPQHLVGQIDGIVTVEDAKQTQKLLKTIEILTQQVKDVTEDNRKLQQLIDKLQKKI